MKGRKSGRIIIFSVPIMLGIFVLGVIAYAVESEDDSFSGAGFFDTNAHVTHLSATYGPQITCSNCHGVYSPPMFADGQYLEGTVVCTDCHSDDGAAVAKQYWNSPPGSSEGVAGSWADQYGYDSYCGSCHDGTPGWNPGESIAAPAVMGDGSTYGFMVSGHGKESGNYERLSWQHLGAAGNPAAGITCTGCHDTTSSHYSPVDSRLRFPNDDDSSLCQLCHDPGTYAAADPQWYTSYEAFRNSMHGGMKCTTCHEVHGQTGEPTPAMTMKLREDLCTQCHTKEGHSIGSTFGKDGDTYRLECVSCHNVHVVTGTADQFDENKSPITKFSDNTEVWGDEPDEKMDSFVLGGTYRTPNGDSHSGEELADYPSFCLDCHGTPQAEFGIHGGISWGSDNHGTVSANVPNGGGAVPNWNTAGKAYGWDGDDCVASDEDCWPVTQRGAGEQIWSRGPYDQVERMAGANFILSCSDCHVTHESGVGSKLRGTVNNQPGSTAWNTECNACHYYYSDWHAGMSCGNASCHQNQRVPGSNSIHGIDHATGSGATRSFDPDLVFSYSFENNLKDSGDWRIHGVWRVAAGSFTPGVSGSAIQVSDHPVEVGTENSSWSTDEGAHGTWKYTEMKHNMTLEAWVNPSEATGERKIMAKHTYWNGGYALVLKNIDGRLRVALLANVNGGAPDLENWDTAGCNGLRGAYSSVEIPLDQWTHVAATWDSALPDADPGDTSVGRIRIYVNGHDVTDSDPDIDSCFAQPQAGEEDMFPYSDHSPDNQSICNNGSWCASALSIGGLNWSAPADNFVGRLDEIKVWNVTKDAGYFAPVDEQVAPVITSAAAIDQYEILVNFSEPVYAAVGQYGGLGPEDFVFTDDDDGRIITGVEHDAGGTSATLTLSAALDPDGDIGVDTVAAAADSIYDDVDNAMGTGAVTISGGGICPDSTSFQLDEAAASAIAADEIGWLSGVVNNAAAALPGDGRFHGDGASTYSTYIDFEDNDACLQATTNMTVQARIRPQSLEGTGNYIRRVIDRGGSGNWQLSVWRNNSWAEYATADSVASIALWVRVDDQHGGDAWKPVLTDYRSWPVVGGHWYQVKAVWNSNKPGGVPGELYTPADIYIDDLGTDGAGAGEYWAGMVNATDAAQALKPDSRKFYAGDRILPGDGDFVIGANINNHASNVFLGEIDWIAWKDTSDYSGTPDASIWDMFSPFGD